MSTSGGGMVPNKLNNFTVTIVIRKNNMKSVMPYTKKGAILFKQAKKLFCIATAGGRFSNIMSKGANHIAIIKGILSAKAANQADNTLSMTPISSFSPNRFP